MRIRQGTWDSSIVQSVLVQNEYGLPDDMSGMIVVDIGAHIGSFAVACQKRNAKRVICFEPDPENFLLLNNNVNEDADCQTETRINNCAVTGEARTDLGLRRLDEHDYGAGRNTGHVDVFGPSDTETFSLSINRVLAEAGHVNLLKLDCEGAEWDILRIADLFSVDAIVAELHEPPKSDHPAVSNIQNRTLQELSAEMASWLRSQGFEVAVVGTSTVTSKLTATKTNRPGDPRHKRRLLWVGDSCVPTGYGKVTEQVCRRLVGLGWDVHVLGVSYNGDPHRYPYSIYPAVDGNVGGPRNGVGRLKEIMDRVKPDVVLVQDDSWNVSIIVDHMAVYNCWAPTVGYIAIDSGNVRRDVAIQLNNLKHAICHTQFGVDELNKAGYTGKTTIAGHGVLPMFTTYDRKEARSGIATKRGGVDDAFIFGCVGVNQPRKRMDLTLAYFNAWWKAAGKPEDAYLYLHTNFNGTCDITQLADFLGCRSQIIATDGGLSNVRMPSMYNAFDVMISTSEGESFGLTHLESMACGVPNIALKCAGLESWAGDAVYWVEPDYYSFTQNRTNTMRWIASEKSFVSAMQDMYASAELRKHYTERGIDKASEFNWDDVTEKFHAVLSGVLDVQSVALRSNTDALSEFE